MAEGDTDQLTSSLQKTQPNIVRNRAHLFEHGSGGNAQKDNGVKIEENVKPSNAKIQINVSALLPGNDKTRQCSPERDSPRSPIRRGFLKSTTRPCSIKIPTSTSKPKIISPKPQLQSTAVSTRDQAAPEPKTAGEQSGSSEHRVSVAQKSKLFENESGSDEKHKVKVKGFPQVQRAVSARGISRTTAASSSANQRPGAHANGVKKLVALGNACKSQSNLDETDASLEGASTVKDLSQLFKSANTVSRSSSNVAKVASDSVTALDASQLYARVNKPSKSKNKPKTVCDSTLHVASAEQDVSKLYATVNKQSTNPAVHSNAKTEAQSPTVRSGSSQNDPVAAPSKDLTSVSPPPVKPPRTFAHDAYLIRKGGNKSKHKLTSLSEAPENLYDEVSPTPKHAPQSPESPYAEIAECRPETSSKPTVQRWQQVKSMYEDIENCRIDFKPSSEYEDISQCRTGTGGAVERSKSCAVSRRRSLKVKRPASKPPPPPRPPQPTVSPCEHNQNKPSEVFVSKKTFSNPMYARQPEIIPIETFVSLKRCKSDESLYAKPLDINSCYDDPIDCMRDVKPRITEHGVVLDHSGYAVPEGTPAHSALCQQLSYQNATIGRRRSGKRDSATSARIRKSPMLREKVKRAYSVLRPKMLQEGLPAEALTDEEDSDNETDIEQHRRRVAHVNSIREKYGTLAQQTTQAGGMQLFSYALIVSLGWSSELNRYETHVLFDFPQQPVDELKRISEFCFPDSSTWNSASYNERYCAKTLSLKTASWWMKLILSLCNVPDNISETFSFVLTNEVGQRQYGHCRRFVPSGQSEPEVFCVVSPLQASRFYDQLLVAVEKKRHLSLDHVKELLQSAYGRPLPDPGKEAWIRAPAADNKKDTLVLKRSRDSKLEDVPFDLLLSKLSLDILLKVFGSILLERRLIFMAKTLNTLTGCIHALVSLMYPFEWVYTYVPVLPLSMIDVCCSPTPFIVGVLGGAQSKLRQLPMEQVLIVDLDKSIILQSVGDEAAIIPKKLQKALIAALRDDSDGVGASFPMCADTSLPAVSRNTIVFEAFLRMFVETVGHYTEYLVTQQDGLRVFENESFVKAVSSKSIRMFLEWFTQTQHFEVFITQRLEKDHTLSEFETRVFEYRDEMEEMETSLALNMKLVGKKMINFFFESGGKIKKAFRRNVFI